MSPTEKREDKGRRTLCKSSKERIQDLAWEDRIKFPSCPTIIQDMGSTGLCYSADPGTFLSTIECGDSLSSQISGLGPNRFLSE